MKTSSSGVSIADRIEVVRSPLTYEERARERVLEGVHLDSVYEAKVIPFLRPGDLVWSVGIRTSELPETPEATVGPDELTPVEARGGYFFKWDDLVELGGAYGAKVRASYKLALLDKHPTGLVTAGARISPQLSRVARVGEYLGVPTIGVTPDGKLTQELEDATSHGMSLERVGYPSFPNVLMARAKRVADERLYRLVPFGMVHPLAMKLTAAQVENLKGVPFERLVVPLGSGTTLMGIARGFREFGLEQPILGVQVGGDYEKRLKQYERYWR